MTHLQIFTLFFFGSLFILIHFIFYGIKEAKKKNRKIKELNPINLLDNYEIVKINNINFIARYIPTKEYIYFDFQTKKSYLVSSPFSSELMPTEAEAFNRLETFLNYIK